VITAFSGTHFSLSSAFLLFLLSFYDTLGLLLQFFFLLITFSLKKMSKNIEIPKRKINIKFSLIIFFCLGKDFKPLFYFENMFFRGNRLRGNRFTHEANPQGEPRAPWVDRTSGTLKGSWRLLWDLVEVPQVRWTMCLELVLFASRVIFWAIFLIIF